MKRLLRVIMGMMALVALVVLGILSSPAVFADEATNAPDKDPVGEIFTGSTFTKNSSISWAGAVKSFSPSLYNEGWRIRVLGAYGRYGFTTDNQPNTANPALFEITPGVQFKKGPLISKLYLGLHGEQHKLARPDRDHKASKMGYGLKVISENWINLPMNSFVSLDGSYSTLNTSYQGMLRAGMAQFMPRLSMGPEAQVVGNEEYYQLRFGGFARWKLQNGSIEGSAGYAEDYDKKSTPYFAMSWLRRF